ncbi:hypothetical protein B0H13DRAFT_2495096 [Mycena leptocephala]|nr:hypothetical protein B0H13DRAFT_2495096 [Mycena leptocephala]
MSRGNNYAIRNPASKSALQAAEQTWHDWIVPYLAARGMPGRPDWALQPLPGLQSVRVTPAHAPTSTPPARRHRARLSLPTPPPSSPAPVLIDLSRVDDPPTPPARKRKFLDSSKSNNFVEPPYDIPFSVISARGLALAFPICPAPVVSSAARSVIYNYLLIPPYPAFIL